MIEAHRRRTMAALFATRTTSSPLRSDDQPKKSEEATAKFVSPAYVQHNPLIADGSDALGKYFGQITRERASARVVVHRIIAVGDYVWAHVNFLNLFNDDPEDTGVAGVDICKNGCRRQGDRALGRAAIRRRSKKLCPVGRAEYPPRQSKRNVLSGRICDERYTRSSNGKEPARGIRAARFRTTRGRDS